LTAGCWGSSAASVAPGRQGAIYAQEPGPRRRPPGSGARTDGSARAPAGRVVAASEMATDAVVGSAVILAPALPPPLGPRTSGPPRLIAAVWPRRAIVMASAPMMFAAAVRCRRGALLSYLSAPHRGTMVRHNSCLDRVDNEHLRRPRVWVYIQTGHRRPINTIGYARVSAPRDQGRRCGLLPLPRRP
jgi:hypothetical protein